jgi:hypothetical protein
VLLDELLELIAPVALVTAELNVGQRRQAAAAVFPHPAHRHVQEPRRLGGVQ